MAVKGSSKGNSKKECCAIPCDTLKADLATLLFNNQFHNG